MEKYIIAIDQGTTSSRVIALDKNGNIVAKEQIEVTITTPQSGWVEQDAKEIYETVFEALKSVINALKPLHGQIMALGITNQRETTIVWDKKTGEPIYNAIVWQSRQSKDICEKMIADGYQNKIKAKTGLLINPYFSATKIRYILDHVKGAQERAEKGELMFGTVDSYLAYRLSDGKLHITDYSNASRTLLFNIHTLKWDEELLNLFNIPSKMLPQVCDSSKNYGIASALKKIDKSLEIPLCSLIGDQQASLFGQLCFEKGDVKNTYGTGCFMLMNTKDKIVDSQNGLLSTISWCIDGKVEYALEGSVFIGGSAVQWLRDGMRFFEKSSDCELASQLVDGSDGVYVVPAFVGLGTPYWDNDARGAVFGLTRGTKREHFINATIESIAYQSKDVMEVMKEDSKIPIASLAVDGGASSNNYLMQFQSDILDCKVVRPECLETTALGAAYLAGLAIGLWKNKEELQTAHRIERVFMPHLTQERRDDLYYGWKKAIAATREFK